MGRKKQNMGFFFFFSQPILHEPIHDLVTKCTQVKRLERKKNNVQFAMGTNSTNEIDRSGSNDTRYT